MDETRYTDGTYLADNPGWHAEDSPLKARWIDAILRRNALTPSTVAEIGCGAGRILAELKRMRPDARYSGFEISPQALALARTHEVPGLEYHLEDMIETGRTGFDVLMAIDVFEHVPDYLGFLRAIKPRATYKLFHIPLDMSVQMMLRGGLYDKVRRDLGHIHYFSRETALGTLRDCGYEIVDWNYTLWSHDLPDPPLRTRLANVPRRLLGAINQDLAIRVLGGASMMVLTR